MMKLVIYDTNGVPFAQIPAPYTLPSGGILYLEVEVPDGQAVDHVDVNVTPNVAILTDPPIDEKAVAIAQLQTDVIANTDLNFMVLEAMAELYEQVFPFLPAL